MRIVRTARAVARFVLDMQRRPRRRCRPVTATILPFRRRITGALARRADAPATRLPPSSMDGLPDIVRSRAYELRFLLLVAGVLNLRRLSD